MDDLTKAELARIRDEDQRQNRRIELLEDMSKVIQDLVLSIHGLAKDMEQCCKNRKSRGNAWTTRVSVWTLEREGNIICTVGAYALANGQAYMPAARPWKLCGAKASAAAHRRDGECPRRRRLDACLPVQPRAGAFLYPAGL